MYEINFKNLIKDKKTSITEISKFTGISRSTLTLLNNGASKGIQFDTLEKICTFLNCTPNDLIQIVPDNYIVRAPMQQNKSDELYAYAVKESVVRAAENENRFYNADENEVAFSIFSVGKTEDFGLIAVGYPPTEERINHPPFNAKALKKWTKSLSKNQRMEICKQSAKIFLELCWKDFSSSKINVIFNTNKNLSGSIYVFDIFKTKNGILIVNEKNLK